MNKELNWKQGLKMLDALEKKGKVPPELVLTHRLLKLRKQYDDGPTKRGKK